MDESKFTPVSSATGYARINSNEHCPNVPALNSSVTRPAVKTKDDETRKSFLSQLKIAEKIAKKSAAKAEKSPSEKIDADSNQSLGCERGTSAVASSEEPTRFAPNAQKKHSSPVLIGAVKKEIPAAIAGSSIVTGAQILRSGAAMTFSVGGLAGLHTGEAISTLVLSLLGVTAAIYNAITAANKVAEDSDKEQALDSVLISTRKQARIFFENCEIGKKSSAEEAHAYGEFIAAASQHRKFSETAADSTFIARLVLVKEAISIKIAALNVAQLVIAVTSAIHVAALATTVLSALTIGLGLIANAYDIVQGVYGLAAADEKQEKAVSDKNSLERIFEKYKSRINADLANGVFSFYANKAKEGENDAAYAILRIAKGLVGVLVAALGAVLLVLSGGAAAPVAAILGAASSFIFFLGLMAKVIMDTKKFHADQSQRDAYLKLVNPGQDQPSTPATEIDYGNRYIMVRKFAEAIVDGQKTEGEFPLTEILSAMSFTKLDMELLWGMLDMDVTRIEKTRLIEIVLAKKMGIA